MSKEILKPNEVSAPTLFVGVGGTGCKIVKKVAEMCHPAEKENINFACLDTNVNDLSSVASSKSHIYYIQTSTTQTVGDFLNYDEDALRNWFPKNAVIYDKTVSEGAGQVRAISRLALNACIKTGKILPLFKAIDDLFRKDGKAMKQAMRVVIVSTASGGTGSGIMTPLAMYIRDYVQNKYPNASLIVRALILLPETLDSVITSNSEKYSQRRNAYATIKEINAFMMKGSGFFDVDEDLKRYKNLSIDFAVPASNEMKSLGLLPFDFCFLLDGQNAEDSTMISLDQYIDQAALSLYEQNIGPVQKDSFSIEDNIIKEMSKPGMFGRNRFAGIGASVLRYPYEDIVKYISYDWARDAVGGEGDAAKWTKYDKEYERQRQEWRKKGIPSSEWPTRGDVYITTMDSASDNFSKDIRNVYLAESDERVLSYCSALEDAMRDALSQNGAISAAQNAANALAKAIDYTNPANHGKSTTHLALLEAYKMAVETNAERVAASAAEGVFYSDAKTILKSPEYTLEAFIKNIYGDTCHPTAVRYLLYKLQTETHSRIESLTEAKGRIRKAMDKYSSNADDSSSFNADFTKDADEATLAELCAAEKAQGEDPSFFEKHIGHYERIYEQFNTHFPAYYKRIKEYAETVAALEAYTVADSYLKELSAMYEQFFATFKEKVRVLDRQQDDLLDALRFQKGDSVYNVCCSETVLGELSASTKTACAEGSLLDPELNASIFDAVKANVIFAREIRNADVVEENRHVDIFDQILLGYFADTVRRTCDNLDVNIVEAIALENRMKARAKTREDQGSGTVFDNVTADDNKRYIQEVMAKGRRLAAAGIQKLRCEEDRTIELCAYHKSLDEMRNYRMDQLATKRCGVETVSRYEMRFFTALYNLTPDRLDKFAWPKQSETGVKNAGLYHKAYVEYSRDIGPDSTKGSIISTHIDKRWDNIAIMPELDFKYQEKKIMEIHQALIYGLIHKAITYRSLSQAAPNKRVYKYENSEERYLDLVVSNGTLCDEFYEILDALYVSASIVEDMKIIRAKKRRRDLTRNSNYEETVFAKELAEFKLDCLHDGPTSLFEIPLTYYNTLPNSKRYTSEISALVDAVIQTFWDELATFESEKDIRFLLCNILMDQYFLLMDNYDQYEKLNDHVKPCDNPVLDIIFRKVRSVVESTPEPDDYEEHVSRMRARLK